MKKHHFKPLSVSFSNGFAHVWRYECEYCNRIVGVSNISHMDKIFAKCDKSNSTSTIKEDITGVYDCSTVNRSLYYRLMSVINNSIKTLRGLLDENILRCKEFCRRH